MSSPFTESVWTSHFIGLLSEKEIKFKLGCIFKNSFWSGSETGPIEKRYDQNAQNLFCQCYLLTTSKFSYKNTLKMSIKSINLTDLELSERILSNLSDE